MQKHLKAFEEKDKRRREEWDSMNYMLGQYIAYAVNSPKKYPRKPFLQKEKHVVMTDEQMEANILKLVKATGGEIIK